MLLYLLFIILPLIILPFIYFFTELRYMYRHIDIFLFIYKLNKDYRDKKYLDTNDVLLLKNKINNLGVVAVKIVQWSLSRLKILKDPILEPVYNLFDSFYEECQFHEDNYTFDKYYIDFNKHIYNDYQIIRVASGSIAQVYKGIHTNGEIHAIKCIHPDIKLKIILSKYIIKTILWFVHYFDMIYIHLDINEFFVSIEKQIDMKNESNNLQKFYENYKNNDYIIIPKLINYSTHFLIMEYIECDKYDNMKINQYKQMKIMHTIELFTNNTMIIDRFVHADLHDGNWKIKYDDKNNKYKLVILDFGLCLDLEENIDDENKNWIVDLMDSFELNDFDKIIDIILISLKEKKYRKEMKEKIKQFFIDNNLEIYKLDPENVFSLIFKFAQQFRIEINSNFITFIICVLNYKNITMSRLKNLSNCTSDYNDKIILKEFALIYVYPLHIEFAKHHNIFPELCEYMQEAIKKKTKTISEFEEIEKKMNIDDFDEISFPSDEEKE